MKREVEFVFTKLGRFTDRIVSLAQKAVVRAPAPVFEPGGNGYADWVIVAIHGLREYLDRPYRRLLDVPHEMSGIVEKFGLAVHEIPDFFTDCARKQELKTPIWRTVLRLSTELHVLGNVQAIDATGVLPNGVRQGSSDAVRPTASIASLRATTTPNGRTTRSEP